MTVDQMLDAMTGRALDLLDCRSWLLRLDASYETAGLPLAEPSMPVIDSDGAPVVTALVWGYDGRPMFVAEFDSLVQRFRVFDPSVDGWVGMAEDSFLTLLYQAHENGAFAPAGPMDPGGTVAPGGGVSAVVFREGEQIPVDPDTGLPPAGVSDEVEQFLRDQTRGD
jgi:hypothetical protein